MPTLAQQVEDFEKAIGDWDKYQAEQIRKAEALAKLLKMPELPYPSATIQQEIGAIEADLESQYAALVEQQAALEQQWAKAQAQLPVAEVAEGVTYEGLATLFKTPEAPFYGVPQPGDILTDYQVKHLGFDVPKGYQVQASVDEQGYYQFQLIGGEKGRKLELELEIGDILTDEQAQTLGLQVPEGYKVRIGGKSYIAATDRTYLEYDLVTPGGWIVTSTDLYIDPEGKVLTSEEIQEQREIFEQFKATFPEEDIAEIGRAHV